MLLPCAGHCPSSRLSPASSKAKAARKGALKDIHPETGRSQGPCTLEYLSCLPSPSSLPGLYDSGPASPFVLLERGEAEDCLAKW